ncbi:MAG TPA: hypothetical protein VID26_11350 [Candidatus Limnocylindrales bacterium]|jgi:hypothetical protein
MDRDSADAARTRTFLVERYWPGVDEAIARSVVANLERAAQAMTSEGTPVEHVGSILMPADQVVFSIIEAADEGVARRVNERANVPLDRIAAAVTLHLQSR